MIVRLLSILLMGTVLFPSIVGADAPPATTTATAAPLVSTDAWIRDAPPAATVRAGYVQLRNPGSTTRVVTGARSDAFGAIEIHEMHDVDGVARMRRVPQLEVPAGGSVSLAPGGLHLMLFRPQRALAAGARCAITLLLDDGSEVAADFVVRAP